jgi:hypothetical protein
MLKLYNQQRIVNKNFYTLQVCKKISNCAILLVFVFEMRLH